MVSLRSITLAAAVIMNMAAVTSFGGLGMAYMFALFFRVFASFFFAAWKASSLFSLVTCDLRLSARSCVALSFVIPSASCISELTHKILLLVTLSLSLVTIVSMVVLLSEPDPAWTSSFVSKSWNAFASTTIAGSCRRWAVAGSSSPGWGSRRSLWTVANLHIPLLLDFQLPRNFCSLLWVWSCANPGFCSSPLHHSKFPCSLSWSRIHLVNSNPIWKQRLRPNSPRTLCLPDCHWWGRGILSPSIFVFKG